MNYSAKVVFLAAALLVAQVCLAQSDHGDELYDACRRGGGSESHCRDEANLGVLLIACTKQDKIDVRDCQEAVVKALSSGV